eukprot:scaffold1638_cov112-Skeletonema_dohrnii-CCMP3373.AAC.1
MQLLLLRAHPILSSFLSCDVMYSLFPLASAALVYEVLVYAVHVDVALVHAVLVCAILVDVALADAVFAFASCVLLGKA